ncbi:MAG: glycosyltransferase family 1 protein, partial [Bacillota bacterium]
GSGGAGDSGRGVYAQPGEDIIFFVGRLVREKGVDTLLDALPAILDRRPSLRLVIAGTGPNESHLRQRVSDMGLSGRVHFAGHLDDRRRNLLYKWASVAVVPSYYEPFGLTALEAMAAGAPVVVSDTGGLAETVVHEETGLKIPPANPGELAAAVLRLLADRDLAFGLAQEAKAQVAVRYSWSEVAARTAAVYEEVIREARASGWSAQSPGPAGEDWEEVSRRTRVMTRALEPIGRYIPPS